MSEVAAAPVGDNGASAQASAQSTSAALSGSAVSPAETGASTATAAASTPAAKIDWLGEADETTVGYVQNKGWTEPKQVLEGYRNLEKLLGADKAGNALIPPKADAPQAEWDTFYNKLGRPSDGAGYDIKVPEGFGDPEFAKAAGSKFHELGLTQKQGAALAEWWNQTAGAQYAQSEQQRVASFEADNASLKAEWGMKHDENLLIARNTANALGLDAKSIDALQSALGHKGVMNMLVKIGSKSGEADFVTGDIGSSFGNAMTPGQAKAAIQSKMADKNFVSRYLSKDADAVAEMQRLHQYAHPE